MGLLSRVRADPGDFVQYHEEVDLGDVDVAAYAVRVAPAGPGFVVVSVAADALRPLRLHWATADRPGGGWQPAPRGWTTQPPKSFDGGGGAWVTDFESSEGLQLVQVRLKAERGAFAFVLRTHDDRFIKKDGRDMYVPVLPAEYELNTPSAAVASPGKQRRQRKQSDSQPAPKDGSPPLQQLPLLSALEVELRARMLGSTLIFEEDGRLSDREVSGYVVKVAGRGPSLRVGIAAATVVPLRLIWGITARPGGAWQGTSQMDFVGEAALTGVQLVEVSLPKESTGYFTFLFQTTQDRFVKPGGRDACAPLTASAKEEMSSIRAEQGCHSDKHRKRDKKQNEGRHGRARETAMKTEEALLVGNESAEVQLPQAPVVRKDRRLDDLQCDDGALVGGSFSEWVLEEILRGEAECQRSLMHRYNFAAQLLSKAVRHGQEGLLPLFVWLRFVTLRQLVINRNYNVKPREVSVAQERMTLQLAEVAVTRSDLRDIMRLIMTSIGRGGTGDLGQRIRDEILDVQKRNDCKGGMMEEWHQKLHNNTCPDDVAICEALLAYIDAGLDLQAYWARLAQDHITQERLASYDRKICSEPCFTPQQCAGLKQSLSAYLKTLKAVHSGADLESAAGAVLRGFGADKSNGDGHDEAPTDSLEGIGRIRSLLTAARRGAEVSSQGGDLVATLEAMIEARWELRYWTKPVRSGSDSKATPQQTKDVLYLDLALEAAARTAIEAALVHMAQQPLLCVVRAVGLALENLVLSAGGNQELLLCLKEWRQVTKLTSEGCAEVALRAKAAVDRLSSELAARGGRLVEALQKLAATLGGCLGVGRPVLASFSEEVVRSGPAAPLAQLLRLLDPILRKGANLGSWQIIAPRDVLGRLKCVPDLHALQHTRLPEATVLLPMKVGGEEDIPEGAVGVITPDLPDVLSHIAVRARNERKLFASVLDAAVLEAIRSLDGQCVSCSSSGAAITVEIVTEQTSTRAPATAVDTGHRPPQVQPRAFCGRFALTSADFSRHVAGGKSCNLKDLRGQLPDWIQLPASVVIPFGSFEALLQDSTNSSVREELMGLSSQLRRAEPQAVATILAAIRRSARGLRPISSFSRDLEAAFIAEGLPWPGDLASADRGAGAWSAITGVWASKWNDGSFESCGRAGLPHEDLSMAVLCQKVVNARYAFVVHTTNPLTSSDAEVYAELVCGLGEALVGNFPGRALGFVAQKDIPGKPRVVSFPSKSAGLFTSAPTIIFRSDSNCEDLEGFAGAGLHDSVIMDGATRQTIDYSTEPLLADLDFRDKTLGRIVQASIAVERALGAPQDIEGVLDAQGTLTIVQARPQV